jgi:membrane protein implicated in regulation of membrane protease activity
MSRLPGWVRWSLIGAGVLLSPVFAFLLALSVGVLVLMIKAAGVAVSLAAVSVIAALLVRRRRGMLTPARDRLSDT